MGWEYDTGESWLVIVLSFTDPHSFQTAAVLSLEKRLDFLLRDPEISGIIGALKLDCEDCVYPWCIVDFPWEPLFVSECCTASIPPQGWFVLGVPDLDLKWEKKNV